MVLYRSHAAKKLNLFLDLLRCTIKLGFYFFLHQFTSLQKEIEEHKAEIHRLHGEETKLQGIIKSLEKDIYGLKKEIQERDETIQDKVFLQ